MVSVVAAIVAGLLVALSLPPWGWWPLAIIGCALYVATMDSAVERSRRSRFAHGFAFGAGWLYLGTAWMWQLTAPGYVVAGVIFALYHGLATLAAPTGRWRFAGLPLAHTLVEAVRFSFPVGGIPLASLGISQVSGPLAPVARVGGAIALTWVTFQAGAIFAAIARWLAARQPAGAVTLAASGAAVLVVATGYIAPSGQGTGERLQLAAVQGGGEQGTRALDTPSELVTEAHLDATETIDPDPDLDLVLWPENVIDTSDFATSWELDAVAAEAQRLGVPFTVGVTEDVSGQPGRITNAQVVVTPDGNVTSRYDKVRRVPFGEYVPMRGLLEALGAPVDQVPSDAIAGTTPAVLQLPSGQRAAVVISWEVFFGGRVREGVKEG
ncbi:MAG: apolipoprotein N-acyltransferase, partial [Actinomycetota bacterium]|nr:apolipoprotein N-acyltransferase [Actinomycetota bacterium]